jgi:DNA-binding transcriptional ArsR family regulator
VLFQYAILAIAVLFSVLGITKLVVEPLAATYIGFDGPAIILVNVPILNPMYEASPYILPAAWAAVAGTVVWKGRIRSRWKEQGYDYDMFRLVTRMKGSPKRVQLLRLLNLPKNTSQLAKELDADWRTIDNHLRLLMKNGLVEEMTTVGTSTYYIISEHGKKVLYLLSDDKNSL